MNGTAMSILALLIGAAAALVAVLIHERWARQLGVALLVVAVVVEVFAMQSGDRSSASGSGPRLTTIPPTFFTEPSESPSSSGGRPSPLPSVNLQPQLLSQVHPGYEPILKPVVANREFVRLSNPASHPIYLGGWHLSNGSVTYTFPGVTLPAGQSLIVRTGPGSNSSDVLHWNLSTYVWHHPTGTITLRNAKGTLVDTCRYHVLAGETSAGC